MSNKCIVFFCENKDDEGDFVGNMCRPCYHCITTGTVQVTGTSFINMMARTIVDYQMAAEEFVVKSLELFGDEPDDE